MRRAFIIRPFNARTVTIKETKNGKESQRSVTIDFARVDRELIQPALRSLGIEGATTEEILQQNNIRIDMFQGLVAADLVIADITLNNANVFYELGIRHAVRDKATILIRCQEPGLEKVPFDLQTDRYLTYDKDNPAAKIAALTQALRGTFAAAGPDSPVFQLLPALEGEDPDKFVPVPAAFKDAVERAENDRSRGDLELLGEEVRGLAWEVPGMRVVGRAQWNIEAWEGARSTWNSVLELRPGDLEANLLLPTIHQRLKQLTESDQAAQRVLKMERASDADQAEALSLLASNLKREWRATYLKAPQQPPAARRKEALTSARLDQARQKYEDGFELDCNHFYSGLNALALRTVQSELAQAFPGVWNARFDTPEEAAKALKEQEAHRARLAGAVAWSIRTARKRKKARKDDHIWIDISDADLALLSSSNPEFVASKYRAALEGVKSMYRQSAKYQLETYQELGVRDTNVQAALEAIEGLEEAPPEARQPSRVLLFTGHRIDDRDRPQKRFPADMEEKAREAIKRLIQQELEEGDGAPSTVGIAGAASGGDILFHEVCKELGVASEVFLALPENLYQVESVAPAGPKWVNRFRALCKTNLGRQLAQPSVPPWLTEKRDYSIWRRSNLWILHHALARAGGNKVTLIALWDGQANGDGPGGTSDMVARAEARGAKKLHIDTIELFGLPRPPKTPPPLKVGPQVVMADSPRPAAKPKAPPGKPPRVRRTTRRPPTSA